MGMSWNGKTDSDVAVANETRRSLGAVSAWDKIKR